MGISLELWRDMEIDLRECLIISAPYSKSSYGLHCHHVLRLTICSVISRHQQTTLTYDALDRESNTLARGFQKLSIKKGDRVAVSLGNNIEHAIVCTTDPASLCSRAVTLTND